MAKQEKLAPSTRNLAALPDIETLRRNSQAIAMLDALLEATWEYRYFSYQAQLVIRPEHGIHAKRERR